MLIKCIHDQKNYAPVYICNECGVMHSNCPHCSNPVLFTPSAVVSYLNKLYDLPDVVSLVKQEKI